MPKFHKWKWFPFTFYVIFNVRLIVIAYINTNYETMGFCRFHLKWLLKILFAWAYLNIKVEKQLEVSCKMNDIPRAWWITCKLSHPFVFHPFCGFPDLMAGEVFLVFGFSWIKYESLDKYCRTSSTEWKMLSWRHMKLLRKTVFFYSSQRL